MAVCWWTANDTLCYPTLSFLIGFPIILGILIWWSYRLAMERYKADQHEGPHTPRSKLHHAAIGAYTGDLKTFLGNLHMKHMVGPCLEHGIQSVDALQNMRKWDLRKLGFGPEERTTLQRAFKKFRKTAEEDLRILDALQQAAVVNPQNELGTSPQEAALVSEDGTSVTTTPPLSFNSPGDAELRLSVVRGQCSATQTEVVQKRVSVLLVVPPNPVVIRDPILDQADYIPEEPPSDLSTLPPYFWNSVRKHIESSTSSPCLDLDAVQIPETSHSISKRAFQLLFDKFQISERTRRIVFLSPGEDGQMMFAVNATFRNELLRRMAETPLLGDPEEEEGVLCLRMKWDAEEDMFSCPTDVWNAWTNEFNKR
eukprot:PhF_6_TR29215/c0_g1_i1/m.42747